VSEIPGAPHRAIRVFTLASGLMSIAIVLAALVGQNGFSKHDKLRAELESVRALNESLRVENARLRREAKALASSPDYIEAVIRDELGFVKKDELVLIFGKKD
jgi:cell division protein FtsB